MKAAAFAVAVVGISGFIHMIGMDPSPIVTPAIETTATQISAPLQPELPTRVVAPSIGLDAPVVNPTSTDVELLDKELLKGAVRYPTSAQMGVDGTVILFGHSTSLPIVYNQVYKTFNNIQKLTNSDTVSVYTDTREYRYRVIRVRLADATEDLIELRNDGRYLSLVNCNTFAKKTDRFIVEAELEGIYAIL